MPTPLPPLAGSTTTDTASRIIEFASKVILSISGLWLLVEKIAKPYYAWRKAKQAALMRDILAPELHALAVATADVGRVIESIESIGRAFGDLYDHIELVVRLIELTRDGSPEADEQAVATLAVLHDRLSARVA